MTEYSDKNIDIEVKNTKIHTQPSLSCQSTRRQSRYSMNVDNVADKWTIKTTSR
jgi:hypothetical protein